jgi:hypothetical protein
MGRVFSTTRKYWSNPQLQPRPPIISLIGISAPDERNNQDFVRDNRQVFGQLAGH